ncbi:MAG: winged helix-turn-helix transcriptional regulator [Sporocytophaga sp.]|uniref:ArsR/SmtB family transcription factor n=1 Tax=Sporocytophaga sp. TaxID=2231183 RepID=UPI001B1260BB|nr:metalloregulator ArsR/SmtB family transcription factor [Sporocytophaga sp.]MBO9702904.1 winged helix-turn-helix transcriptional regulator [Sporocytophaga sp.]
MTVEARRDVFQAIADPTRRQIISLLSKQPMNLNTIAENFDISRPAISQQIKILEECGLVNITQQGRERYCEARLDKLSEVSNWVDQYKVFWTNQFKSLDNFLEDIQTKKKKHGRKK